MDSQSNDTESRRKFLKTAGKFAVYTPPALMLMNKANAHKIAHSNGATRVAYKNKKEDKKEYYLDKRDFIIRLLSRANRMVDAIRFW